MGRCDERWWRLLLVMQVYIDDSIEPPVFVLAGFIASAEEWEKLKVEWQATLDKPPRLAYVKMQEAHALVGEFKGWNETARDKRLAEFVATIKRHVLAGVSLVVRHDDFRSVFRHRIAKPLDNPYWLVYYLLITHVFEWELKNGLTEKIDFIFDEQLHQSEQVKASYEIFYQQAPENIRGRFGKPPEHRDDKKTLPLQAADILAWHIHRRYSEKERGSDFVSPTMRLLDTISQWHEFRMKERLQALFVMYDTMTRERGWVSLYENQRMEQNLPDATSINNLRDMVQAPPNFSVILSPFLARGTKRFLLVHSCPLSSSPHLHRRSGDKCSLELTPPDQASAQLG
jgi:hypothetical protein